MSSIRQISIKSMTLLNFKGIRNLTVNFDNITDVFGANGTGKTTIFDAFTWLLFGKDSSDRKDFEIKTLDLFGKVIPKIEHEVNAIISVDGEDVSIRRILKENWVKKRGSEESEFSGNVTEYYWNDVPMKQTEFQSKVSKILDESVFKMITSPTFFNTIDWKKRREILTQIAGDVSDAEIASGNSEYEKLLSNLTQGKTLDDYKAQILASVKKAKEDLKLIPTRIDEVTRTMPEAQDFVALETELNAKQSEVDKIDGLINDSNAAFQSKLDDQKELKVKANNLKGDIEIIEANARKKAKESQQVDTSVLDDLKGQQKSKEQELQTYTSGLQTLSDKHTSLVAQKQSIEQKLKDKRDEWERENAKDISFDDSNFCCPTCKRDFEASDIEAKKTQMSDNFKKGKQAKLSEINQQGKSLADEKGNVENEISVLAGRIETGKQSVEKCKSDIEEIKSKISAEEIKLSDVTGKLSEEQVCNELLSNNSEYAAKKKELQDIEASIIEIPSIDNSELSDKRKTMLSEIDQIKAKLQTKSQIEAVQQRVKDLEEEGRKLAQQVADVERIQFTIERFIKEKVDRIEQVVNQKFKLVTFRMFEEQINGGLKETCEAMVNGVPYSDVNTASKINAGLDVINTLSQFYGVSAPIFVDNAESVHTLIDTESQLIRLVVSESDVKLNIKVKELVA